MGKLIIHSHEMIHDPLPAFGSLEVGDVCYSRGSYFIKMECVETTMNGIRNAFDINRKRAVHLSLDTLVAPVIADITLKLE